MTSTSEQFGLEDFLADEISLEELTALALADYNEPDVTSDARPIMLVPESEGGSLLPSWYMPAVLAQPRSGMQRWVVIGIVALLVAIEASGLCSVFGQLVVG